jgi:vacuolar-type H+-ATPase subunit E/Vma4
MDMRGVSPVPEERRLDSSDPVVIDLLQRVSRLEARVDALEKTMNALREKVEGIDSRTWYILTGIILAILIEILRWVAH